MARDYVVNGECMVQVWGGAHLGEDQPVGMLSELGLASEGVEITAFFKHKDVLTDDFGPVVPAEVMTQLSEVRIKMSLIHYDLEVLNICLNESLGGGNSLSLPWPSLVPAAAGTLLGNGVDVTHSGCHFMRLYLSSPQLQKPLRFLSTYVVDQNEFKMGTERTVHDLLWRAIPYTPPVLSSGLTGRLGQFTPLNPTIFDNTAAGDDNL